MGICAVAGFAKDFESFDPTDVGKMRSIRICRVFGTRKPMPERPSSAVSRVIWGRARDELLDQAQGSPGRLT